MSWNVCVSIYRAVLEGLFGEIPLRTELEMLLIRGFAHFDLHIFLHRVYLPMLLPLCDAVFVPFCLGRLVSMYVGQDYILRTATARFSLHACAVLWLLVRLVSYAAMFLVKVHNEIRDTRYLVATELTNRAAR